VSPSVVTPKPSVIPVRDEATTAARKKLKEASRARRALERDEVRRFTVALRRRRQTLFALGVSLGALLVFVAVGVFTPIMALEKVEVTGASRVDAGAIQAALQSELGKPLPLVSTDAIAAAVGAQPLVKSYSTESLPPHTLAIRVVERTPVGYLPASGGFILVDAAGVVMEATEDRNPAYPLFDVAGNSTTSAGFLAGIDVLSSLPAALQGQVAKVAATSKDDVTLVLADSGARVFWGGPENPEFKSRVLAALIAANPVGSVSEYDVSSPNTAVIR
jgi:cell division protein FtsQ